MVLPDVHFEGITDQGTVKVTVTTSPKGGAKKYTTKRGQLAANEIIETPDSEVGFYYPGAVYEDPAAVKLRSANTGHFGRLDSLDGSAKMASMNVFTAGDGGK